MQVSWQDKPVVQGSSGSQDNAQLGTAMMILLLLLGVAVVVMIIGVALLT